MLGKCRRQVDGHQCGQQILGHLGRDQDKGAVAAVLAVAVLPRHSRAVERPAQRAVQSVAYGYLVGTGPGSVSEFLHIHHENGPMHRVRQRTHSDQPACIRVHHDE